MENSRMRAGSFPQEEVKKDIIMDLEGFVQVSTRMGSFMCKRAEVLQGYVKLHGPVIVSLQIVEDPKTKQQQRLWNKDSVLFRLFNVGLVISIDLLDPTQLDKSSKDIYESLSGIQLV